MNDYDHLRYREILLGTMRSFMAFCQANGLRWYLAFGAAIGAVRHAGMIPWDDDVDVFMPREDYERMLSIAPPEGFYFEDFRTSEQRLPFAYAKFCDARTTLWEQHRYPCIIGVFIDIFPLDSTGDSPAQTENLRMRYRSAWRDYVRSFRRHSFASLCRDMLHGRFRPAAVAVADLMLYRPFRESKLRCFREIYDRAAAGRGDNYAVYCTNSEYSGIIFPKRLFSGTLEVPFEDFTVQLPSGNDDILRALYGDYMQLPPPEQRVSAHFHHYVDLGRRISLQEAEKLKKNPIFA